jgi:hypothetical protein
MKKNVMLYAILALSLALTACGKGDKGDKGDPGQSVPVVLPPPPVDATQADIDAVVADENNYRLGLGQTMLSRGLSCTLYTFTGGDSIKTTPDSGHTTLQGLSQKATFLFADVINQQNASINDGLSVLPAAIRPLYLNMFMVRCQGQIVVLDTDYYKFDLTSDDGSLLYFDGSLLIDNDNNHGAVTKSGTKYLRRGVHSFRVDYAQSGAGSQAFILQANGGLIEGRFYMH